MSRINVDLKKMKNINNTLPSAVKMIEEVKHGIGLLRWRVPEEIQSENDIKQRLAAVLDELERMENDISEVYAVTNSSIFQYKNSEARNTGNADKFR